MSTNNDVAHDLASRMQEHEALKAKEREVVATKQTRLNKFYEWLDTLGLDLNIIRYARQSNRLRVTMGNGKGGSAEFKKNIDDNVVVGSHGNSEESLELAVEDYLNQIEGKYFWYHQRSDEEFVPVLFLVPTFGLKTRSK